MSSLWFNKLPKGWAQRRVKTISPVMRGASPRPIDDPTYFDDEGEYAWVRISDVTASNGYLHETTQRLSIKGALKSVKLAKGSLFLSIAGSVGKPCLTQINACIHDGFVYFPYLPQESQKFIYWIFESGECFRGLGKLGTQLNLNTETVGNISIPFPPLVTQRTIADFLDRETARIDQLIQKKQRLVELIKEREAAKLEALTFGHPQAKSYEHYPFKWACRIPQGQVDPKDNKWKDKPLIAPNHIESKTGRLFYVESAEEQGAISGKYAFPKGTVVYSKIRPALAKACIAPTAGLCSADMYPIIPFKNLLPEFLLMQLLTYSFTDWTILESMRVAMPKINRETIGSIKLIIPPISTQKELISLHDKSKKLAEATIDKTNQSITRLREFRSALITAAVTGQIDVDEWSRRGGTDAKLDAIAQEMEARA